MREIKFRAWDKDNNIMYPVIGLSWQDEQKLETVETTIACWSDGIEEVTPNLQSVVLMQFTGLKDKNGKEIYEGDILKDHESLDTLDEIIVMDWEDESMCPFPIPYYRSSDDYEVLGNVWENPEIIPEWYD